MMEALPRLSSSVETRIQLLRSVVWEIRVRVRLRPPVFVLVGVSLFETFDSEAVASCSFSGAASAEDFSEFWSLYFPFG